MSLPETVEVHKLTIPEFHALEPFLDPDRRHELLDGQILSMPIPGTPHSVALSELNAQFSRQGRPDLYVWLGGLRVTETTELLPDLCLLERKPLRLDSPPAAAAKLVVEVSDTTLDRDTGEKLQAYRSAGVAEYWVIDVQGRQVLRYLAPDYRSQTFAGGGTPLSPQAYPDVSIDVGALFAGS
jgi:Uma2 family endonuclease